MRKKLIEGLKYLAILFVVANALSYYRSLDLNKEDLKIESFNLIDGSTYEVVKDKPLVIHIWATWCPTCKVEAANIERLSKNYEVITIAANSGTNEKIQKYMKQNDLTFRVVNDNDGVLSKKFKMEVFPTTFIYNSNKKLKFTEVGYTTTAGLLSRMLFLDE